MRRLMIGLTGVCLGAGLAGAVLAQPIIIPLERQDKQPQQPQAVVSAPPVAPPEASASLPTTTDTAGGPKVSPQEESAAAPSR